MNEDCSFRGWWREPQRTETNRLLLLLLLARELAHSVLLSFTILFYCLCTLFSKIVASLLWYSTTTTSTKVARAGVDGRRWCRALDASR